MTAIQQYLHVENEVYLVSSLYPIVQGGDSLVGSVMIPDNGVLLRQNPYGLDFLTGDISVTASSVTSAVRTHSQPTDDSLLNGSVAINSAAVTTIVRSYDTYPDPTDRLNGALVVQSGVVTTIVKQYSTWPADATVDSLNGAVAIISAVRA